MLLSQTPFFTDIATFIDFIFEPTLLVVLSLIISIYLFLTLRKKEAFIFSSSMFIMGLVVELIKFLTKIPRPLTPIIIRTGYAFPSGHATATLVFSGLLAYIFLKNKSSTIKIFSYILAGILILITGLSRVYLRVHFISDILGGYLIGGIILVIAIILLKK